MQNAVVAKLGLGAKIGLTAALALGGIGFLVYSSAEQAQHYLMVDELVGDGLEAWHDKALKVHGWVEPGSIVQGVVSQEMHQTFVLAKGGKRIRVFSQGPLPDTFKDGAEVVASGRLVVPGPLQPMVDLMCAGRAVRCSVQAGSEGAWVLEASDVSAKCATHYGNDAHPMKRVPRFE